MKTSVPPKRQLKPTTDTPTPQDGLKAKLALAIKSTAPRIRRMTLDSISKASDIDGPLRALIYGVEGVGKTKLVAQVPGVVFLCPEDSKTYGAPHFPALETWEDALDAARVLAEGGIIPALGAPAKALAIDTLDWLEPLVWRHVLARCGKTSMEEFKYGVGYAEALVEWRRFIAELERMRKLQGVMVFAIAHSQIRHFDHPGSDGWDRYQLKIHDTPGKSAAALWREWCDIVLFANYDDFGRKDTNTRTVKGVHTGARFLYTEHGAWYDGKNRHNLPTRLPLDWPSLEEALREGPKLDPGVIIATIEENLSQFDDLGLAELREKVEETLRDAGKHVPSLLMIENRVKAVLAEHEEEA